MNSTPSSNTSEQLESAGQVLGDKLLVFIIFDILFGTVITVANGFQWSLSLLAHAVRNLHRKPLCCGPFYGNCQLPEGRGTNLSVLWLGGYSHSKHDTIFDRSCVYSHRCLNPHGHVIWSLHCGNQTVPAPTEDQQQKSQSCNRYHLDKCTGYVRPSDCRCEEGKFSVGLLLFPFRDSLIYFNSGSCENFARQRKELKDVRASLTAVNRRKQLETENRMVITFVLILFIFYCSFLLYFIHVQILYFCSCRSSYAYNVFFLVTNEFLSVSCMVDPFMYALRLPRFRFNEAQSIGRCQTKHWMEMG